MKTKWLHLHLTGKRKEAKQILEQPHPFAILQLDHRPLLEAVALRDLLPTPKYRGEEESFSSSSSVPS